MAGRDRLFVGSRLALLIAGIGALALAASGRISPWWVGAAVVAFATTVLIHDRALQAARRAARAVRFYEAGLARLAGEWPGTGDDGNDLFEAAHPFALDLDLYGRGSLFERLASTRTNAGRRALARWLSTPSAPDEVRARQLAIQELTPRVELREALALLGEEATRRVHADLLEGWGRARKADLSAWRVPVGFAVVANLAALLLMTASWSQWSFGSISSIPWWCGPTVLIASGFLGTYLRPRVEAVLTAAEGAAPELKVLSGLLQRIEVEPFASPALVVLQRRIAGEAPASRAIAQLAATLDRLDWRLNQIFLPVSLPLFWATQHALAVETWRARYGPAVHDWFEAAGELEALSALAAFAFEQPEMVYPQLVSGAPRFEAEKLGHPLLPLERCVHNDVRLGATTRLLIVSGSNMSGKSTLLRSIGVNTVLAQAGSPVRAASLTLTPLSLGASLRAQDSLLDGRSRFLAELDRLRTIVQIARDGSPLLFLIDELLSGTNSHDRKLGAEALMRELHTLGAIGLLTTHDLALTESAASLGSDVRNVHFVDHLEGGEMRFDYRLHEGVVSKSNALELMRHVGLI